MNHGLDTSVVVRLIVGLPASQAQQARKRLEQAHAHGDQIIVTDTVLAESYHALVYHYHMDKDDALERLRRMAESGVVHIEPPEAIAALKAAPGAGFVDRLILHRHRSLHASTLTFDRALGAAGAVRIDKATAT